MEILRLAGTCTAGVFFNNCENNNKSGENEYNDTKYSILLHTVSFYNNVLSG
jgi:hypothetical protein